EHHTGLAVDIVSVGNQRLDGTQENTAEQRWLMENSWKYGFILRYPKGKTHITGIYYEPWHYRYVGKEAAEEIFARNITLEEYISEKDTEKMQN
ncbi:MAG: M15 family metallopeptidase, partial [Oscillospiraceae bacterium]|nr:M15 family metallopeptidase [Oscillospiraceae bacterium]